MQDVALKLGSNWRGGLVVFEGREIKKVADPGVWNAPSRGLLS
jgi:hypothetical protein